MNTTKTKRAEPILVEQVTTPVTKGCAMLATLFLVVPLLGVFGCPPLILVPASIWFAVVFVKKITK